MCFAGNRPDDLQFGWEVSVRLENVMRLMDTSRQILHSITLYMATFGRVNKTASAGAQISRDHSRSELQDAGG